MRPAAMPGGSGVRANLGGGSEAAPSAKYRQRNLSAAKLPAAC